MIRIGSLFTGIGGIEIGFEQTGFFKTVWGIEKDKFACQVLKHNFPNWKIFCEDVYNVNPEDLDPVDMITAGFPCQAFSIAGYRRGFDDPRGNVFFRILDYIEVLKPKIIFLENVRNLKGHDKGRTYQIIKDSLETRGYFIKDKILNTMDYGNLPQNRERIYIVCFKEKQLYEKFEFPPPINLSITFKDLLDPPEQIDSKYYYTEESKYYDLFVKSVTSTNDVYQLRRVYVRKNQSGVCPTLTANMGGGGHNVPIIKDKRGIRKLTPRECARLQGYPDSFEFPVSDTQAYKQAGNSVSIPVVRRIAEQIKKVLEHKNTKTRRKEVKPKKIFNAA